MPIIPHVGRKAFSSRSVIGAIYGILILLSLTTLYPILIMLSISISGPTNEDQFVPTPRYLYDQNELFRMYVFDKYGNYNRLKSRIKNANFLSYHYNNLALQFNDVTPPKINLSTHGAMEVVADFDEFIQSLDSKFWTRGFEYQTQKQYVQFLKTRFHGRINDLNQEYSLSYGGFEQIQLPHEDVFSRVWNADNTLFKHYHHFMESQPFQQRVIYATDMIYAEFLKQRYGTINQVNTAYRTSYEDFHEIRLPHSLPKDAAQGKDWEPACPKRVLAAARCRATTLNSRRFAR